jgi:hypothetical protein
MALPTAQLGALGQMSMPYSIPTVEKGPSIWEKALASFLVSAAGQAAERGTENLMSRDYASEFGEDPAKGFGRLMGPKVGEREATRRRAEEEGTAMKNFELDSQRVREQAARDDQSSRDMRQFSNQMDLEDRQHGNQLQNTYAVQQGQDRRALAGDDAARELAILKSVLEGSDPTNVAQGEYYRSMAGKNNAEADFTKSILDRRQGGGGAAGGQPTLSGPVNPAVAAFKNRAPAPAAPPSYGFPPEQSFVSTPEDVARMLAEGRSPEEIMLAVSRQQATNDAAQALPLPNTETTQPMRNIYQSQPEPQIDPVLAGLLQELGMAQKPGLYQGQPQLGIYSR